MDKLGRQLAIGSTGLLMLLTVVGLMSGSWKVIGISWTAYSVMVLGGLIGTKVTNHPNPEYIVVGYGIASGSMLMSAAIFLVPSAVGPNVQLGGIGIATGLLVGFTFHTVSHYVEHLNLPLDDGIAEVTTHALAAGLVIGVVYATMPELGVLLGLAIISHKGPAGYALTVRRSRLGRSPFPVVLPAAAVGVTALPIASLGLTLPPSLNAVVFGIATGIFIHVALDFLPRCDVGGEVHEIIECCTHQGRSHNILDDLRLSAVGSTVIGAALVVSGWYLVI